MTDLEKDILKQLKRLYDSGVEFKDIEWTEIYPKTKKMSLSDSKNCFRLNTKTIYHIPPILEDEGKCQELLEGEDFIELQLTKLGGSYAIDVDEEEEIFGIKEYSFNSKESRLLAVLTLWADLLKEK